MWTGTWDSAGTTYTGEYEFPDGTAFKGVALYLTAQVIVFTTPDGFSKTTESPVAPHFEFTGTWVKDGKAGSPMMPPDPPSNASPARI